MSDTTTAVATVDPAAEALSSLSKVRFPKGKPTTEALDALTRVGDHIASSGEIKTATADVQSLTEELATQRAYVDGLVTYRNKAIRTAQSVGFSVTAITEAYGVSRGTVQNIANATKVREALKVGAKANGETAVPSADAILSKVSNLGSGALPAILEHAAATGEFLDTNAPATVGAPKARPTVKSVLTRAESLSDALANAEVKESDAETLTRLHQVIRNIIARTDALVWVPESVPAAA